MTDKAFVKGLTLLSALANSPEPRALGSLAEQLGLTKSNTHRLLVTLSEQGFVMQDGEKGLYRPTLRLWELGAAIVARIDVMQVARPVMERLAARSGETVHLAQLSGEEVIYLDKIEGTQAIRAYTQIGGRAPALCVATGKAIMSWQDETEIRRVAAAVPAATPKTITDPDAIIHELEAARRAGVAFNRGEWRHDVAGAAAPIRDNFGKVVAAIGISGPAMRLLTGRLEDLAEEVKAAALDVSRGLGLRA